MNRRIPDSWPAAVRELHRDYTGFFDRFFDFHIAAREPRARHLLKRVKREIERLAVSYEPGEVNAVIEELSWLQNDLEELLYAMKHGAMRGLGTAKAGGQVARSLRPMS